MNKRLLNVVLCSLLCLILFSTNVMAATFTDIKGHWAESYIKDMTGKGIIAGFSDNTFRPDESVTYAQVFVMLARMAGATELEQSQMLQEQEDFLKEIDTTKGYQWAYKELAMMLTLDVIDEDALTYFFLSKKIGLGAKKEEIAFYLGKAMLLENEAKALKSYELTYTDTPLIVDAYKPYIYLLTQKGVLTGSNNKIEPQSTVNRAVFSTMLSRSMSHYPKIDFSKYLANIRTEEGVVIDVIDAATDYIKIERSNGTTVTYQIDSKTELYLEGQKISLASIKEGMNVICKIDQNNVPLEIRAENPLGSIKGVVDYVGYSNPQALGFIVTDSQNKKTTMSMGVSSTADITLNDEKVFLKDLAKEDEVTIYHKDNTIYKITARSRVQNYEGLIRNLEFGNKILLSISDAKSTQLEFDVTTQIKSIQVTRNGTRTSIDRLRDGDSIKVTTDYGIVTHIAATAPKSEQKGSITEITIGPIMKMKLIDDNIEKVYTISPDADIRINEKRSSIYDLRLGFEVQINLEGTEIVYIATTGEQPMQEITGKVVYFDTASNMVMLNVTDSDGKVALKNMYVQSGTRIFTIYGDHKNVSELKPGTEIIAVGNYEGGVFTTFSIIIK
ncbi:MAG: S-layer homology domain-containing protein [Peptostreptococcales bacterium]